MHIGRYLKKLRKERNYTQEKLAELVGVDARTIRRIEKESAPKENYSLKTICKELGIPTTSPVDYIRSLEFDGLLDEDSEETIVSIMGCRTLNEMSQELQDKWLKANKLIVEGQYEEALDIYLAFNMLFPNEYSYLKCGELYIHLERYEDAIIYVDKALLNEKYTYKSLVTKGYCFGKIGDYKKAKKMFEEAAQNDRTYEVYYNLGVTAYMEEQYDEAIKHYLCSIDINPEFTWAYLNLSVCYFNIGRYDDSFYYANKCIEIDETVYQAYGRLGEYYKLVEKQDEAIVCYTKCLEADENNYQALLGLAICFATKGNVLEAGRYFKKWLMLYVKEVFKFEESNIAVLIDIGLYKTRFIKFEQESQSQIRVYLEKCAILINMTEGRSYIMIGTLPISDDTDTIVYPVVGKMYEDINEYRETIELINDASTLVSVSRFPIFIDFDKTIKVEIIEQEDSVDIKILFNDKFEVIGRTDTKGEGFKAFVEKLAEFGQCRIQIGCKEEELVIECISNVTIK